MPADDPRLPDPRQQRDRPRGRWRLPDRNRLALVLYAVLCVYFLLSILRAAGLV